MKTIFKHFSIILTSLMLCTSISINALQQSKVRAAGNFALAALKKGAGAMKANPYTAAAAVTAIAAGKYVHYRYNFYNNEVLKLQRKLSSISNSMKNHINIGGEITIHLPDGKKETLKTGEVSAQAKEKQDDIENEVYSQETFGALIKEYVNNGDCFILARVVPRGPAFEGQVHYFDAHSFNTDFFRRFPDFHGSLIQRRWAEGAKTGYPIVIEKIGNTQADYTEFYQVPTTNQNIDQSIGVQYFIYNPSQHKKGLQYLCSYKQKTDATTGETKFAFYTDIVDSPWYNQERFIPIVFYANMPDTDSAALQQIKILSQEALNLCQPLSLEYPETERLKIQAKLRSAQQTAQRIQNYSFVTFLKDYLRNDQRFARTHRWWNFLPPTMLLALGGTCIFMGTIGLPTLLFIPNSLSKIRKFEVISFIDDQKILLQTWKQVVQLSARESLIFAKIFGCLGTACFGLSTIPLTNLWLAERDRLARTTPAA